MLFWSILIAFVITIGVVIYPNYLDTLSVNRKRDEHLNNAVTVVLITLTGIAASYSAFETNRQRKVSEKTLGETIKQTEYSIRPYIRLQLNKSDKRHDDKRVIDIVNAGRGVAINVVFKPIVFILLGDESNNTIIFIKSRPMISAEGGWSSVSIDELRQTVCGLLGHTGDYWKYLLDKVDQHFAIEAEYDDLLGNHYIAKYISDNTYNDMFRIEYQVRLV